ncbi:Ataxin-10 [Heterocephalus glaber]|uniref:Ataxin-10 n=1 Tax=Heterocephalus glaber TaxID=10181 RepID=G5BVC0_HETGA|nr:Ataxin-10 [Heterocephalus glaber]
MAAPRPQPARLSGILIPAPIQDLEALRALTALFKEQRNRETAPRTIFQRVLDILKRSSHAVELACRDPTQVEHLASSLQLITECFRCLRNACIECSVNQNSIRNLDTIGVAVDLILLFRELRVEQDALLTAFRCGLQFLGNIASRNEDSQSIVWVHAFPELFMSCLNHPDKKIVAYCSMILFTSLNSERMKELEENLNIAINVIEAHQKQPESEWPFLIITDHFLKNPELVQAMYAKLSHQERVTLLDLMIAKLVNDEQLTKDEISVFLHHAELIASSFVDQCRTVLKLTSEPHAEDEEVLATIRLLDVLCEMTANTELLGYLQVFPGLLEGVIDLLQMIHVTGKDTTNIFSTSGCVRAEGDVSNMAEGFKSHLIRLIGNLCYKNKDNQDKVNELDGIPLILDSCSIDDSNPWLCPQPSAEEAESLALALPQLAASPEGLLQNLAYSPHFTSELYVRNWPSGVDSAQGTAPVLTQWVVYAIRNLTEDNSQNQDLIAKLEDQGLADASLLKKMGFEVEKRGEKLILKSTRDPPLRIVGCGRTCSFCSRARVQVEKGKEQNEEVLAATSLPEKGTFDWAGSLGRVETDF